MVSVERVDNFLCTTMDGHVVVDICEVVGQATVVQQEKVSQLLRSERRGLGRAKRDERSLGTH